ncbi:MAG: plastocyanin/azurin family copper-binding protein [Actinomycetota bacterium]
MISRRATHVASVLAVALLLAGCAGAGAGEADGPATGGGPDVRTVVLDMRWSRFSQTELKVRAGETIRFVVRNHDPIPHELIVGDQAVHDYHEQGTELHHRGRPGEVSVAAGATAETRYTFIQPGTLLFGCHLPGHWAYGMQGVIRVV